jgi:hypothetical protein
MLGAMDVPAAAAGPWIALGAVLGVLLLLAAAAIAVRLRSSSPPPAASTPVDRPRDDLADFLDHPPGTPGARDHDGDGWAALTPAAPPVGPAAPAPAGPGSRPGTALAALAVAALLLVGAAAALAAASRSPEPAARETPAPPAATATADPSGTPDREEVAARLAFEGVVLEEHAVGVTAAYPELELTTDAGRTVARLRLPAVNCLAASAPPQASDPGCRAARTEYAELSGPDLRVVRDGDDLTVSGRFATEFRPPGGGPQPTGRSYDAVVTVAPTGGERDGWSPAEARLQWGDQDAVTRADGPANVLRAG